jgi:AraC-like DNA-binding protein
MAAARYRNIIDPEQHTAIVSIALAIIDELQTEPIGFQSAVRAHVWSLMLALHREAKTTQNDHVTASRIAIIAPALEAIAQDYTDTITIESLAQVCYCSVTHFRRLFTRATGRSPLEYITRFRIDMATTLLAHSEQSITQIAGAVGYGSLSSFNRHFARLMGISPKQWRRGITPDRATKSPPGSKSSRQPIYRLTTEPPTC